MDNQNNTNGNDIIENAESPTDDASKETKPSAAHSVLEYVEMFVLAVIAVLVVFTFAFRLCQVQGSSMMSTLKDGERIITTNAFYTPEPGDVIVFHQTSDINPTLNEPIIKRVIATEGQTVKIDFNDKNDMKIWVDGVEYADENAYFDTLRAHIYPQHSFNKVTGIFEATVPEGHVFVLGDNRDNSNDSRSVAIGFVDERRILGKAIFRIKPFTWLN